MDSTPSAGLSRADDSEWRFAVQQSVPHGWYVAVVPLDDGQSRWTAANPQLGYLHAYPVTAPDATSLIAAVWEATLAKRPEVFRTWPVERRAIYVPLDQRRARR